MSAKAFSPAQWTKIHTRFDNDAETFGLPRKRSKSVILGAFNIRKFTDPKKRTTGAWKLLTKAAQRFDLLAIQEIGDDLSALQELRKRLGNDYGLLVSDATGVFPGDNGVAERLAFLFRWKRVRRTDLGSDITYDRSKVAGDLFENRVAYFAAFEDHAEALAEWEDEKARRRAEADANGTRFRSPTKPTLELPRFLTFIRQPHCASFEIVPKGSAKPLAFLGVNVHLLYGTNKHERRWEFDALLDWLVIRAKQIDRAYAPNMILLGDCNFEFDDAGVAREDMDARLKLLNSTVLKSRKAAKVNFPFLDHHPTEGLLRTNARATQTYDQIGLFSHKNALPDSDANDTAGASGADAYDYGVFNFVELFAHALHNASYADLSATKQKDIIKRCQHDVSDHMPLWVRLPIPGA